MTPAITPTGPSAAATGFKRGLPCLGCNSDTPAQSNAYDLGLFDQWVTTDQEGSIPGWSTCMCWPTMAWMMYLPEGPIGSY